MLHLAGVASLGVSARRPAVVMAHQHGKGYHVATLRRSLFVFLLLRHGGLRSLSISNIARQDGLSSKIAYFSAR